MDIKIVIFAGTEIYLLFKMYEALQIFNNPVNCIKFCVNQRVVSW